MSHCKRRQFLKTSLAGAGAALAAPRLLRADAAPLSAGVKTGADAITLGRTPVKTSFLALGTGMNGGRRASDLTRLGQAEFTRILRHGLDSGRALPRRGRPLRHAPVHPRGREGRPARPLLAADQDLAVQGGLDHALGRRARGGRPLPPRARRRLARRVPDPLHAERPLAGAVRAHPGRAVEAQGRGRRARGRGLLPRPRRAQACRGAALGRRDPRSHQPPRGREVPVRRHAPRRSLRR